MTYKTVLVHVQPAAPERLAAAAALARRFEARLIGVGAEMIQPLAFADPYGYAQGEWVTLMRQQSEKELADAEAAFLKAAAGMDCEWRRHLDLPAQALARDARAADIVVVGGGAKDGRDGYRTVDVGELIVTAGRPVLVAPRGGGGFSGEAAMVAWKDCREARRAVADALPLLTRAKEVLVLAVAPENGTEAAEAQTADVADWLKRHGAPARAKVAVGFDDEAAGEIVLQARSAGADLIVAGGYGHTRVSEWLMGGVTRSLLEDAGCFVLFSH